jgi:hypothetical protein
MSPAPAAHCTAFTDLRAFSCCKTITIGYTPSRPALGRPAQDARALDARSCTNIVQKRGFTFRWPYLLSRRRNKIFRDSSSSGSVPRSGVRGNTSPCWVHGEVIPATDQSFLKGSCAHHGYGAHTKWIGNDKSVSRLMSAPHLAYTALLVELRPLVLQRSRTRKFAPARI